MIREDDVFFEKVCNYFLDNSSDGKIGEIKKIFLILFNFYRELYYIYNQVFRFFLWDFI